MSFVIIETSRAHHAPFPPCSVKSPPLRGGTIPPPTGNLNQKPCVRVVQAAENPLFFLKVSNSGSKNAQNSSLIQGTFASFTCGAVSYIRVSDSGFRQGGEWSPPPKGGTLQNSEMRSRPFNNDKAHKNDVPNTQLTIRTVIYIYQGSQISKKG